MWAECGITTTPRDLARPDYRDLILFVNIYTAEEVIDVVTI